MGVYHNLILNNEGMDGVLIPEPQEHSYLLCQLAI
jgi:hypothetical protein